MENFDSNSLFSSAFQFIPNDKQLIKLLQDRISSSQHRIKIRDVEVYGELTPHQIFIHSEFQERAVNWPAEGTRYCFTTLKRTKKGGKRCVRTTRGGTWKAQNVQEIHVDNTTTSLKRAFSFIPSKSGTTGPAEPDRWVMYEYSLIDSPIAKGNNQDIANCKVIKKAPTKREREGDKEDTVVASEAKKMRTSSGDTYSSETSTSTTLEAPPMLTESPTGHGDSSMRNG